MNWVGGSRKRLVLKSDAKKQKEFFEKRKMQQRLKNMGVSLPTSCPAENSSGNMDLVTLFIVNQIASKKASKDPRKVTIVDSSKRDSRRKGDEPLVLPMSPCTPSQLNLVESEHQHSCQGFRKKKAIPQGFKCQQLSPVLESAFSDNSASDYVPPAADTHSPFSATSPTSSGQESRVSLGMFSPPLSLQKGTQRRFPPLPHFSPPPWDTSVSQQINREKESFQPFPDAIEETETWYDETNTPLFHIQTPRAAAPSFFGIPEPDETQRRDYRCVNTLPHNQPEDKEPTLDFILHQSGSKQQLQQDVFMGFNQEACEREAYFESGESKVYSAEETCGSTSMSQIVPEPQYLPVQSSNGTDINFACLGCNTEPMNGCESLPSYSCHEGYLSSDSSDDSECCHPCRQASASCMDSAAGTSKSNNCSQETPKLRGSQYNSCIPTENNFQVKQKFTDEAHGNNGRITESGTAQISSSLLQAQSSETCKCRKNPTDIRDAQTQTAGRPLAETCDASTQCGLVAASEGKYPKFSQYLPTTDLLEQHLATGRQSDQSGGFETHPGTQRSRSEWKATPCKKNSKSGSISVGKDGKVNVNRPMNSFQNARITANKEAAEGRDESARQDETLLMKDLSDGGREEVASVTGANTLSAETETLQEIADILLLLTQKKKA